MKDGKQPRPTCESLSRRE